MRRRAEGGRSSAAIRGNGTGARAGALGRSIDAGRSGRLNLPHPSRAGPRPPRATSRPGATRGRGLAVAGLLLALAALCALPHQAAAQVNVPDDWALIPSGLSDGDSFRLLFLSSVKRDGSSSAIADYNGHVQFHASLGHAAIQEHSSQFKAVGCTRAVDARDNTGTTGTGVPIYWLNGNKVADDNADFYDGSWSNETNDKNESGSNGPNTNQSANYPLTGCDHDGTEETNAFRYLGADTFVQVGRPGASGSNGPIHSNSSTSPSSTRPMYGLSSVFTVAAAASTDATLSALALENAADDSAISLNETFVSTTTSYTADVVNGIDEITIDPTVNESNATFVFLDGSDATLTDADTNKTGQQVTLAVGANTIKVKVTAEDDSTTETYTVTVTRAAGTNTAATGKPTITGTAQVGGTLTAGIGTIADDTDGLPATFPDDYTFQWVRVDSDGMSNPEDIGTDSGTYMPEAADVGKRIRVKVSFTDGGGADEGPLSSDATAAVAAAAVRVTILALSSATEGGTDALVLVTLSRATGHEVVIPLTATPENGAVDGDYTGVPASLTFGPSETQKTFTVKAVDDFDDDDGESLLLGFGTLPAGVTAGSQATATVNLVDNDSAVRVSFGASSYTATEGGTAATVTVQLTQAAGSEVEIPITSTPQNGAVTGDYSGVPASVTFGANDSAKTFTVTAVDDNTFEIGERVRLELGTLPTGITADSQSSTRVNLDDNDGAEVSVSYGASTYTATEGGTSATVTVQLNETAGREVVIPITSTPHNGARAGDYSGVPASVRFSATETSKTFTVTATDDQTDDDDESVLLGLGTLPLGVTTGSQGTTTVSLGDNDDPAVTVSFVSSQLSTREGGAGATVEVELNAAPERELVIPITAMPQGGAVAGDYSGVPVSLTFGASDTERTFTVTAVDDSDDDDGESVQLRFGTLPARVSVGNTATARVDLDDNDNPTVSITAVASSVFYNDSNVKFTVARVGAASTGITVTVNMMQDRPFLDTAQQTQTVFLGTGVTSATLTIARASLALPLNEQVKSGTLTATLAQGSGYNIGTPSSASVDIQVFLTMRLDRESYTVSEGAGALAAKVIAQTGARAPVPTGNHGFEPVTLSSGSYTALPGEDYSSTIQLDGFAPGDFTLEGGTYRAQKTINIAIVDDALVEPDEVFGVELVRHNDTDPRVIYVYPDLTKKAPGSSGPISSVTIRDNDSDLPPEESNGALRLIGPTDDEGRLEVFHKGEWGTVCDDRMGDPDNIAPVFACQLMGYATGEMVSSSGTPAPPSQPIWLDDVRCLEGSTHWIGSSPSKLHHCYHAGWGLNNCTHAEDQGGFLFWLTLLDFKADPLLGGLPA